MISENNWYAPARQRPRLRLSSLGVLALLVAGCGSDGDPPGDPAAVTLNLLANPVTVSTGTASTLSWTTTNASACTASGGWSGTKAIPSASQSTGALSATTTYTLTCEGTGDSTSQSVTINVTNQPPAPTVTLNASPTTVTSGTSSTLTWSSSNATSCTASGGWSGTKALSGNQSTGNLTASTTFTLTCNGAGGTTIQSRTVAIATTGSLFPLRVEPGKRYLVDAQGNPFFLQGDTAWILTVQLSLTDAEIYMEDRRQRGVNALVVELIENTWGDNAPENYYGEAPFTGADFATPNPAYFDRVAQLLDIAAAKGQILLLSPAYMGYQGHIEGWYPEMVSAGATVLRNYGRFLGQRFAAYDNIMWVHGGDWNPPQAGVTLGTALADGIKEFDPQGKWLHTVHADRNTSALDSPLSGVVTVDATYTSDTTVVEENHAAWFDSGLPYFLYESYYEDGEEGDFIRKMAYQSLLSGASGHVTGNNRVWKGQPGWQAHLDTEGSQSLPHIKSLFTTREWWRLVPDTGTTFLTGGVNPGRHQAPASLADNGSFGIIYVQESRQLTVNMARLSGPRVQSRWFDPANGTYSTIAGSPFNASGSRAFNPPGNNSQGHPDWVLVLESVP